MTSRRSLLQAMALAPLAGCAAPGVGDPRHYTPSGLPLRRVRVRDERVIRTIAGLRPFRPAGFVVRAERMNDKTVVHNYGHGGGGITLSWGSSDLAAKLALETPHRRCAVLGCGALGLAAARLLQDRGREVTIYARELPPDTTSNIAGGQWSPTSVYDEDHAGPAFLAQFEAAMRYSYRHFQDLVGPRYGVRWLSNYTVLPEAPDGEGFTDRHVDMYPQHRDLNPGEHPFPARYVRHYNTMLIEPATYLPAVMQDFFAAGGRIVVRDFRHAGEVLALDEPLVINCTGLGSRGLFGDEEMTPVRGQLTFLLPQEEVRYLILGNEGLYMFPRSDGILLGGTFEPDEWDPTPDLESTRRILDGHRAFFEAMADPWAGRRGA